MMSEYFTDKPKHDWKCNRCQKKITVAFYIRLCDKCFDEFEKETEAKKIGNNPITLNDDLFAEIFLPPKGQQN